MRVIIIPRIHKCHEGARCVLGGFKRLAEVGATSHKLHGNPGGGGGDGEAVANSNGAVLEGELHGDTTGKGDRDALLLGLGVCAAKEDTGGGGDNADEGV